MAGTVAPDSALEAPPRREAGLRVSREAHATVVWLLGDHDVATLAAVRSVLNDVASLPGYGRDLVVVDLSSLTFMSSGIIEALGGAEADLVRRDRSLFIRGASDFVSRILRLAGYERLLVLPARGDALLPPGTVARPSNGSTASPRPSSDASRRPSAPGLPRHVPTTRSRA